VSRKGRGPTDNATDNTRGLVGVCVGKRDDAGEEIPSNCSLVAVASFTATSTETGLPPWEARMRCRPGGMY
jgi:hypothetical protein